MRLISWFVEPKGKIPDSEVIYAIGDLHGRDDLLARLHESIEEDIARSPERKATVIYLGDYVDRGPDSKAVIDRLLDQPVQGAERIFLKGNHEEAMLRFLAGETSGGSWLNIGGGATAWSYGVSLRSETREPAPPDVVRRQLIEALPPRHMEFFRNLRLLHEAGDYLFVHAGIKPGRAIEDQDPRDLLWIRGEFLNSRRRHEKIVIHGHSSSNEVVVKRNRICVDTTAYATDRLSCVVLEGDAYRFMSAEL